MIIPDHSDILSLPKVSCRLHLPLCCSLHPRWPRRTGLYPHHRSSSPLYRQQPSPGHRLWSGRAILDNDCCCTQRGFELSAARCMSHSHVDELIICPSRVNPRYCLPDRTAGGKYRDRNLGTPLDCEFLENQSLLASAEHRARL